MAAHVPAMEQAISQGLPAHTTEVNPQPTNEQANATHRQHGMIGVKERIGDDLPSRTPRQFFIINKDPHEFRYGESWVRLENIM